MERQAIVERVDPGTAAWQIKSGALTCGHPDEIGGRPGGVRIIQLAGKAAHGRGEICENTVCVAKGD
jgi:hypothetical protein